MKKLLAANRSEIAIRIMRAASELGLRTVAMYSEEDRLGLHRFKADEAYEVGKGKGPIQAYLDIDGIVALAVEKRWMPSILGTGFFLRTRPFPEPARRQASHSSVRIRNCWSCLVTRWRPVTLRRRLASGLCRGQRSLCRTLEAAKKASQDLGFPLIAKASFGGGGRGMRIIRSQGNWRPGWKRRVEKPRVPLAMELYFLEKYIERARHIEVQILADPHGNVMHLYERDCSVQRRHQKIVEVAPAARYFIQVRKELCDAAVQLARTAGYRNAGTVEFLVDADSEEWFFIEVNPRIQVEHTVTEMVTGVDHRALTNPGSARAQTARTAVVLPTTEGRAASRVALQCRITTEDPENNFSPDYGKITTYRSPGRLWHPAGRRHSLRRGYVDTLLRFSAGEGDVRGEPPCLKPASAWTGPCGSFASVA